MESEDQIYRKLQQHLDESPAGFAAAESGADIRLLKHLLTPDEAKIAILLSNVEKEPVETIFKRLQESGMQISIEELRRKLDEMVRKGTVLVYSEGFNERRYMNVGVSAGGMIDFQVNRITQDLVDVIDKYHEESFTRRTDESGQQRIPGLRTIPVEKSVPHPEKLRFSSYDDVRKLVEQSPGPFSVANCVCRQTKDLQGKPCKYSDIRETCLQIGPDHARQYIEMGRGREITREEAFEVLDRAREAGFILQPENSLKPENICCCCGDCCGPLSAGKNSPRPADMYTSNYYVVVDSGTCTGCEVCISRCQMDARVMKDGKSIVALDRCIGCGNCVVTCQSGASQMIQKEQQNIPFRDKDDTFMHIMANKLGGWERFKMRTKMLLGMKM